jgi:hypothetical protein
MQRRGFIAQVLAGGVLNNERDNDSVAKALGPKKVFNLGYRLRSG